VDQPLVSEDQPQVAEDQLVVADQTVAPLISVPQARTAQPDRAGPQVRVPHPHNTRLQQRLSVSDGALTTLGVTDVKGKLSGSAIDSITAFLEKRKSEGTVDPSANVSVNRALKFLPDRVIIKAFTQMDVLDL
jgi:hypothetical protein